MIRLYPNTFLLLFKSSQFPLQIAFYTTKCMIAVWNIRYNSIHCAANLLAGIAPYHVSSAILMSLYVVFVFFFLFHFGVYQYYLS